MISKNKKQSSPSRKSQHGPRFNSITRGRLLSLIHILTTFDNSLQPILNVINQIKSKYPNAPVAYTERVPGYLLADADLDVKTPVGFASAVEDGNDPSPDDTVAMDSLMTSHGVRVLLYNCLLYTSRCV